MLTEIEINDLQNQLMIEESRRNQAEIAVVRAQNDANAFRAANEDLKSMVRNLEEANYKMEQELEWHQNQIKQLAEELKEMAARCEKER